MFRKMAAVSQTAARLPHSYYGLLSKDRFGFTSLYWDGVCLTISRKINGYKSDRYTYHTISLNEKELIALKAFLIYGDVSNLKTTGS